MMKRTHDQKWLQDKAMFSCRDMDCSEQVSYPAHLLKVDLEGEPVCVDCYEYDICEGQTKWSDLEPFWPFEKQ